MVCESCKGKVKTIWCDMSAFIKEKRGNRYGYWRVLAFHKIDRHNDARWRCECTLCGNIYSVKGYALRNGQSTKCVSCAARKRLNGR